MCDHRFYFPLCVLKMSWSRPAQNGENSDKVVSRLTVTVEEISVKRRVLAVLLGKCCLLGDECLLPRNMASASGSVIE